MPREVLKWHDVQARTGSPCMSVPSAVGMTSVTTVSELEEAIFTDSRWDTRIDELRRAWMLANTAFHAMVDSSNRAEQHQHASDGHAPVAELVVVARAQAEQRACGAYVLIVALLLDMLEVVQAAHIDDDVLIEDAETRSTDGWMDCHRVGPRADRVPPAGVRGRPAELLSAGVAAYGRGQGGCTSIDQSINPRERGGVGVTEGERGNP
jgi:hypothetical protein